jgi:hypothetical protein
MPCIPLYQLMHLVACGIYPHVDPLCEVTASRALTVLLFVKVEVQSIECHFYLLVMAARVLLRGSSVSSPHRRSRSTLWPSRFLFTI